MGEIDRRIRKPHSVKEPLVWHWYVRGAILCMGRGGLPPIGAIRSWTESEAAARLHPVMRPGTLLAGGIGCVPIEDCALDELLSKLVRYPVPGYGLLCPVCKRALDGAPSDACPECAESKDMDVDCVYQR